MGSWDFRNIGFSCDSKDKEQVEELLECMGVDFDDVHGSEDGEINDKFWNIIERGRDNSNLSPEEIYSIVIKVFKNTDIFYEVEEGNNTSDWYSRFEKIFDSKNNKIYLGEYDYCIGEGEGKEEKEWVEDIEIIDVKKEVLIGIIDIAAQKDYGDIVKKLTKSFNLDYVSPYLKKNSKKKKVKKPSRDHLNVAKSIDKLNIEMEDVLINDELLWDINQDAVDALQEDDVIEMSYYTKNPQERDEYVALTCKGELLGLLLNRYRNAEYIPQGVQGSDGLVFTWATVKKNENGNLFLKYEYRFLDLDYESIRRAILDTIGDNDRIPILDTYIYEEDDNSNMLDEEDEKDIISIINNNGNYVSKKSILESSNKFNYIVRGFELNLLKIARYLGVDYLKYDLNSEYCPDYNELYNKLISDIGNRFEILGNNPFGGGIKISNLNTGDILQLYPEKDKYLGMRVLVQKGDFKVGYLDRDATSYITVPLEKKVLDIKAEIVDIVKDSDASDKGDVYVKLVFSNKG